MSHDQFGKEGMKHLRQVVHEQVVAELCVARWIRAFGTLGVELLGKVAPSQKAKESALGEERLQVLCSCGEPVVELRLGRHLVQLVEQKDGGQPSVEQSLDDAVEAPSQGAKLGIRAELTFCFANRGALGRDA